MHRWFFETFNDFNHGKFMVARFDAAELAEPSLVAPELTPQRLIRGRGWGTEHLLVLDLQTGEGAIFGPGGLVAADLNKHKIWVCPMFEPFLMWLYEQDRSDMDALPRVIAMPNAPRSLYGYRRPGPEVEQFRTALEWIADGAVNATQIAREALDGPDEPDGPDDHG